MVDDDLVAAVGTERSLDSLGYGSTCFYVSYYSAVFGFITAEYLVRNLYRKCWTHALNGTYF